MDSWMISACVFFGIAILGIIIAIIFGKDRKDKDKDKGGAIE